MTLIDRLTSVSSLRSEEMTEKYQDIIEEILSTTTLSNMNIVVEFLLNETNHVPNAVTKSCLQHLAVATTPISSHELREVAEFVIAEIKKSSASFDEADFALRESLCSYFLKHGMWTEGAEVLGGANIDTADISDNKKADTYIRCAEAYIEDNSGFEAENFVQKASSLMDKAGVSKDWQLQLRYRVVFARVLDSNKKFTDAALRYYYLSKTEGELEIEEDDLLGLYGKAMACAILGKISAQRTRVLNLLCEDSRLKYIGTLKPEYEAHVSLLTKMSRGNLIQPKELEQFSKSLLPHQNGGAGNGFSIPENAVLEHNLFVAGNIYDNIALKELAKLLCLDEVSTERVICRMITEGRLDATINQEDGFLYFSSSQNASDNLTATIKSVCDEVNECVMMIAACKDVETTSTK